MEKELTVPKVEVGLYIAILFSVKGTTIEKVRAGWKIVFEKKPWVPLLHIKMPCGEQAVYQTFEDIPLVDTPCPCGDPHHWLLKYQEDANG